MNGSGGGAPRRDVTRSRRALRRPALRSVRRRAVCYSLIAVRVPGSRRWQCENDSCPFRRQPCERGASGPPSNGVGRCSVKRLITAQSWRFCSPVSGGVGLSIGFASRRSPVRSRYAPSPICRGFPQPPRRTRAARVPEMAAPWQRASGVRGLGDDTEPVLEHPSPRLIALVLAERAHVVARPDLGRVPGDLGRLGGVDAAGGRRSSRTTSAGASA
jgi:hypothetical protein